MTNIETGALVIGWNRAICGRESVAGELFATMTTYFEKLQKNNKLTSFEPVFLAAHGGDFNGFWYVKGTHAQLTVMQTDGEFVDHLLRAQHCIENLGVIPAYVGATVPEMMTRWMKQIPR